MIWQTLRASAESTQCIQYYVGSTLRYIYTCFWPACVCCWHWYCVRKCDPNFDLWFSDLHFELVKTKQRDMNVWLVVKWPSAVDGGLTNGELTNLSFSFLCSPGGQEVGGSDGCVGGTQPLCRAGQDAHGRCTDANTSNVKKNAIYYDNIQRVNFWVKKPPFFNNK